MKTSSRVGRGHSLNCSLVGSCNYCSTHRHHEVLVTALDKKDKPAHSDGLVDKVATFGALKPIGIVHQVWKIEFFAYLSNPWQVIRTSWSKAACASHDCQHIVRAQSVHLLPDCLKVSDQLLPPLRQLHHHWFQPRSQDGLEAGLLVNPGPDHILCFRSSLFEAEQAKGKGKASSNRHQKATFGPFYARPANKVKQHGVGEPVDYTTSCSLWLHLSEIPTSTYSMAESVVAPGHQRGVHPGFTFSHPAVTRKVIAVHLRKLCQQELNLPVMPTLLRHLALLKQLSTPARLARPCLSCLPCIARSHQSRCKLQLLLIHGNATVLRPVCNSCRSESSNKS